MSIVVINAGSSSIKYTVYKAQSLEVIQHGLIEEVSDYNDAFLQMQEDLLYHNINLCEIEGFVHRVVHGGEKFHKPVVIDNEVIHEITHLIPLAPLHNPANLKGIIAARNIAPNVPHIAIFDTSFHQSMPEYVYRYPLPHDLYEHYRIRKYGFHGTSHDYVSQKASQWLGKPINELNLITFHIGNGVSACAIAKGISIDTSMGMTPLEGLMMGSRSGSIDPSIVGYLMREKGLSIDEIDVLLNKQSGLKAIAGTNDLRSIINAKESGDLHATLAVEMFCYRLRKQLGEYMAILNGVDAIIFTGGIGEHSHLVRKEVCKNLSHLGIRIDETRNLSNATDIHSDQSKVKLLVIPTDEEYQMAFYAQRKIFQP
ncbi:MAG: acetate kinase [Epsilonproteobacteria bacterium]|nr:acetate kinase [Campylobacterota bacterium]